MKWAYARSMQILGVAVTACLLVLTACGGGDTSESGVPAGSPTTGVRVVNGYTIEPGADLSGADLSGADLVDADLTGADLTGADLEGPDLTDATWDEDTRWPEGFTPPGR